MNREYDLTIIGGGVLGAFHAYHAINKGLKVCLIEKNLSPIGASYQNFGQVVPSGFDTDWQRYGIRSLEIYNDLQSIVDISVRKNGSIYIASDHEELQLIEELNEINLNSDYPSELVTKQRLLDQHTWLKPDYPVGGLFFKNEVTVNPRQMVSNVLKYLKEKKGLDLQLGNLAIATETVGSDRVLTRCSNGQSVRSKKVLVCSGTDFQTLFPELFATSGIVISKLQMLSTKPIKNMNIPGSVLTGWTIRRYEAFQACPSYRSIKEKEDAHSFKNKFGIHLLIKQAEDGSLILGDSHQYYTIEEYASLFSETHQEIDDFIMLHLNEIVDCSGLKIEKKWNGFYSQHPDQPYFAATIDKNIHVLTAIGGKGMTAGPGFSEYHLNTILS